MRLFASNISMRASLRKIAIATVLATLTAPLSAEDIFSRLMKDSVATFSDAGHLLYHSMKSLASSDKKQKAYQSKEFQSLHMRRNEIRAFLLERGYDINLTQKPITKKAFSKALIDHFNLKTGLLTSIFKSESFYFDDAVKLGLFSREAVGDSPLTTREMVKVYFKAENLRNH